jgi:hypothetical protein
LKIIVIGVWVSGVVLAMLHLRFLAGSELHPGFWPFAAFLLAAYSLPLFWLTRIPVPQRRSPQKYITLAFFLFILAVSLLLPTRRFFPGYRPDALEGLAYFFLPIFECGLIGAFLIARTAAGRLTKQG